MKTDGIFNAASLATFLLAHAVWEAQRVSGLELRSLVVLAIIYGFSIWIRDRFYDEKTTFFDLDSRVLPAKDDGLIIFGEQVEDLAFESRERRLLISLVDFGGQKYKIYLAWIASTALAIYLQFRIGGLDVVEVGASFLIISGIYFSPFLNQRLVPLFTAFILAIYAFGRSADLKVTVLFGVFLATFAYSIVLYRDVTADRVNPDRKYSGKRRLQTVGLMVLALVFIYGVVDHLLPEESPFHRKLPGARVEPKQMPRLSTEKISRQLAEQVVKFGERNQDGPVQAQGKSRGKSQGGERGRADQGHGAGGDPSSGASNSADDHEGQSPGGGGNDETQARPGQETSTPPRASEAEGPPEPDTDESHRLTKSANGNPETRTAARPADRRRDQGHSFGKTGPEKARGDEADGPPFDPTQSKAGGEPKTSNQARSESIRSPKEKEKEREKKIEDLQKEIKLPLEIAKGFLFLILVGVAVFALFRYFSKPKSKDDEVVRQQLTSGQRQKLQTLLQRMKARGLSPHDEIVETYNALLTIFELGHHPREEWLPAEDFSNEIAKSIPSLSQPFHGATMQFSKTLYGRKSVGVDELEKFRGQVAQVLKFFQLS